MARQTASAIHQRRLDAVPIEAVAEALHFALDLHDLTRAEEHLAAAREFAEVLLSRYRMNGLFVRAPGDPYYGAKLGCGLAATGLLTLRS